MLLQRFYLADRKGMTVWPCASISGMRPIERRLWVQFWTILSEWRAAWAKEEREKQSARP